MNTLAGIKDAIRIGIDRVAPLESAHRRFRGWEQSRQIEREQDEYEARARQMGLVLDSSGESARLLLTRRLAQRGVFTSPKARGELHIIYASGESPWDVVNIVPALRKFGRVTTYLLGEHGFDAKSPGWVRTRNRMNSHFVDFVAAVHEQRPVDLLLTYYSGHHVGPEVIKSINALGIITATFHLDDRLLFRGEQLGDRLRGPAAVASAYDLNLTQAPESLVKYRVEGAIPMLWPLAANPEFCYPRHGPFRYDVSFVGTAYGNRISTIRYLQKRGVEVATFGRGWPSGFLPAERFPEIYCASRINLNFDDIGYTTYQCGKIRDFEVPMCGALMLSTHNKHLKNYFDLDSEVFTFRSPRECLQQVRRLLADELLCETARKRARERALREHTWEQRVDDLLETVGLIEAQPERGIK